MTAGSCRRPWLTDGVVVLRPFEPGDAAAHLAGEDAEQVRWLSGGPGSSSTVDRFIRDSRRSWAEDGPRFVFAVCVATTGELAEMVEATTDATAVRGLSRGAANISYGLYPPWRGRGLATRAVALVEDFLAERGVRHAVIRVDQRNTASLRLPARRGYRESGLTTEPDGTRLRWFTRAL